VTAAEPAAEPAYRVAEGAPWLDAARRRWQGALAGGRLPHALLVHGDLALGTAQLAEWIARATLCERPATAPCGACESCRLHAAGNHPDLVRLGVREDKKQIAVDDVRALIADLGLKSYRGGRRVAIVCPADALNVNGANALLKTLEEPGAGALLILVIARLDRLPATIASRCQRLSVLAPPAPVALAWLAAQDPGVDWGGALALAGGAPLGALELDRAGAAPIAREMADLPAALARGAVDVVGVAERFAKQLPAVRLRWIENWVTDRLRSQLAGPGAGHTPAGPDLPARARTRHIQSLYGVLDGTRAAQAALGGSANVPLLFERVLFGLAEALGPGRVAQPRQTDGK
jgi:DNA polymerase-3 subunit delta'